MPVSHHEGKAWLEDKFRYLNPKVVFDVGAGEGIYAMRYRPMTPWAYWVAIEVFEPYIDEFDLRSKYDRVWNVDVRDIDVFTFCQADLVIFGDVLEHMPRLDALGVLAAARMHAGAISVSVPIIDMPQGPERGNCAEAHLDQWYPGQMQEFLPDCEWTEGNVIGTYFWTKQGAAL